MSGVAEPLVAAQLNPDEDDDDPYTGPRAHEFELEEVALSSAAESPTKRWKLVSALLSVVIIVLLSLAGTAVYKYSTFTEPESDISAGAALAVTRLGNYSSRCTEPWEYACGHYTKQSLQPMSVLGDAQKRVDFQLADILASLPETALPRTFYEACVASKGVDVSRDSPEWWWDRGLEAGGLLFGRSRSNTSRYRHLAVQITGDVGGDPQLDCTMAAKTACDGKLWEICTRVGGEASFDEQMCILGGNAELACAVLETALNVSNPDRHLWFSGTSVFCLQETKRLWPTATSMAYEDRYASLESDLAVATVFKDARAAIVHRLKQQHQHALSKALAGVELFQRYVGPPEVYHARLNHYENIHSWWEELLLEKEEFDRARLYFSEQDWDMSAHTINAYYWPYANAVYVTEAIGLWMLEGAGDAERIGRLGFLLGHELGHAIHSNIDLLDDPAVRAAYHAGEMCLTEEYGSQTGLTTHEDMADRVAYGVVGELSSRLATRQRTYCALDGCNVVDESHVAFLAAAQPFCATESIADAAIDYDTHSPSAVRVRHSLLNTAAAASAWECEVPPLSALCPVVGAPTQY
jgi:hypothetical protein